MGQNYTFSHKSLGYYVKIMVHEEILYILFSNMHSYELHLNNFKGDYFIFLHPQIPDFQIVSRPNIVIS